MFVPLRAYVYPEADASALYGTGEGDVRSSKNETGDVSLNERGTETETGVTVGFLVSLHFSPFSLIFFVSGGQRPRRHQGQGEGSTPVDRLRARAGGRFDEDEDEDGE